MEYATFDAEITYFLRETLSYKLTQLGSWEEDMKSNLDLYLKYWLPFGEVLTDMERVGFKVNVDHLKVQEDLNLTIDDPVEGGERQD